MDSSAVIRKLFADLQQPSQGRSIAYFYFDFRNRQEQLVQIMLRSIILQLSAQSPYPYQALDKQFMVSMGQTLPNYQDLWHVLEDLLLEPGRTYIVLDALDECEDNELGKLVELILRLGMWKRSPLHILITSQPRAIFADAFKHVTRISFEARIIQRDIRLFVTSELRDNRKLKTWAARADEIIDQIVFKSNGMSVALRLGI